ncbi:MAG: glycoside hydrolase family 18 protein [Candidatus Sulfotelmatobacter sp.]
MKIQQVQRVGAQERSRASLQVDLGIVLLILSVAAIFLSVAATGMWAQSTSPALPKRLVADYGYWSKYQTPPYGAAQIPINMMTHILHAGINIDGAADGSIDVPDGFVEPELISKAHNAGVKVFILFGGDAGAFSTVAANATLRGILVQNLWDFAQQNGYDGVDIDWEYPGAADHKGYYELMNTLRTFFVAPTYQLSADIAPWGGPGYNLEHVVPVLDFLNIMTYDCAGPWTDDAQLNSPIFWDWHDPEPYECQPGGSVQEAITAFLRFAPAAKINMGTPFYGYDYETVTALWQSCTHCDFSVLGENYGTFIKQRVNKGGWVRYYDSIAGVPYLLRGNGKPGFITYDDPSSTYLRVWYTDWERGLGGTFMWSLDADYDGTSQDLLNAMYNATLNNPSGATQ